MGIDLLLAEHVIAVTIGATLIDPVGGALGADYRNLVNTVGGGEHMGKRADGAFLLHAGDQRVLKLIRDEIAALGVNPLRQGIPHFVGNTVLGTNLSPERLGVGIGCTTDLGIGLFGVLRLLSDGSGNGSRHLALHGVQPLLAVDFLAQIYDVLLQTLINLDILIGEDTPLVTIGGQESLCLFPGLCALGTQFVDFAHCNNPPKIELRFDQIEASHQLVIGFSCLCRGFFFCSRNRCRLCWGHALTLRLVMSRQLIHKPGLRLLAGEGIGCCFCRILFGICQDVIRKAKFNGLVGIHPCFRIHQVGQLGTGKAGLDLVGVENAFLDLIQHFDGFFHIGVIPIGRGHRIVNHHQCSGSHQHLCSGHRNDGGGRCRDAIDFDRHIALIIHQHGVDLAGGNAVTAGRIEPDRYRAFAREQLIVEHLRCDIVIKPRGFRDGAV